MSALLPLSKPLALHMAVAAATQSGAPFGAFFRFAPVTGTAGSAGDQAFDARIVRGQSDYPQPAAADAEGADALAVDLGTLLQYIQRSLPGDY